MNSDCLNSDHLNSDCLNSDHLNSNCLNSDRLNSDRLNSNRLNSDRRSTPPTDFNFRNFNILISYLSQGPALYAFNDAKFSEADWTGIRMLSQSVKQPDRFKVGYFGMGFKSVFHITGMYHYRHKFTSFRLETPRKKYFKSLLSVRN